MDDLKLVIIPCREPVPSECHTIYNDSYELWNLVWSETLKELDGIEKLPSNEFTRFDFASVILDKGKPISLMCYTSVDMGLKPRRFDSWFDSWPSEILERQKERDGLGLIAAWFCTHPDYRKSSQVSLNFNVTQVLAEVFGKIIISDSYNVGYGMTRNNRSVGQYSVNIGGEVIANANAHNCDVSLVLFEPEKIFSKQFSYSAELKYLWKNRVDFRCLGTERKQRISNERKTKKAA